MELLFDQAPTLLGVFVGALATYLVTAANEHVRWRRNYQVRWDSKRLAAYSEYAEAVKQVFYLSTRLAAARGLSHSVAPLSPDQGLVELATAEAQRTARWETVLLLGGAETVAAARTWHECVWQIEWFARGKLTSTDEWEPALRRVDEARSTFYQCARRELGVGDDLLDEPSWPLSWMPDGLPDEK